MPIVNVTVPPQLAAAIQAAIDDGTHASESDVVREALLFWEEARRCYDDRQPLRSREMMTRREWRDDEKLCVADLFAAHAQQRHEPAG